MGLWFGSAKPSSADYPPLGLNLSGVRDWSTEFVFLDAFKSARPWISQKKGAGWGQGGPLAVNARGVRRRISPRPIRRDGLMFVELDGKYAGGEYVFSFEGAGSWEFAGAAKAHRAEAARRADSSSPSSRPRGRSNSAYSGPIRITPCGISNSSP